ncbi:protein kinase C delta type-like [Engystomops pustulosus]|uniref:protein kinase C delta type-like n=1 Tax=Engystomops pustulosus TaxID=76066 RepID=UPI003AFA1343
MSSPSGEKGEDMKRKRETEENDLPKNKSIKISDEEPNICGQASNPGGSKNHRSLSDQNQVPSNHSSGGQKRKLEEDEEEANKKCKLDDNGAATPISTIAPRGLARFNFIKELGRGGFGFVFLASAKDKNSNVAIKVLKKFNKEKIQLEKRVLQHVAGNPYICRLFATFQTPSFAFLVMELLPGGDLERLLEAEGPLDVKTTALCTAEIICGLQHMHKLGVIHRDIKTKNITIDHQGHIRICDFGVAVENMFRGKTTFGGAGTAYYKSPEMITGGPVGSSSDWWSFGVLLFRLLTNEYPFGTCRTMRQLKDVVVAGDPRFPDNFTTETKDIITNLLSKQQLKRLGYCGDIHQHPFYAEIDWERVEAKAIDPPFPPWMDTSPPASLPSDLPFLQDQEGDRCPPEAKTIPDFSYEDPDWLLQQES